MLSIDNPPDPSCPCKVSALKSDENPSDQVALREADPLALCQIQTSSFSIRDYVFSSRSKDISTTWPFPQQLLEFCLNHGTRDLLPPFEPPDFVRAHCCSKTIELSEQPVGCSEGKAIFLTAGLLHSKGKTPLEESGVIERKPFVSLDRSAVEKSEKYTLDRAHTPDDSNLVDANAEIASTVTDSNLVERISAQTSEFPCLADVSKSASEASSELEVVDPSLQQKPEKLREHCGKKIRLIVKLGANSEITCAEDIASTSGTVSDPMASKVCPVCKVFASTSNTTLNAHIDQCLSTESDSNQVASNFAKLKVKPKKTRLMTDVYATAPRCTLEDLDRRNGSNWATDLALVAAPANKVDTEAKRPKLSPLSDSDDEDVGAVYVDSNGIKVRILSKSNDPASEVSKVELELKKNAKSMQFGGKSLISKKKHYGSKYSKYIKLKQQSKKIRLFKLNKSVIAAPPEEANDPQSHQEKVESCPETLNTQNEIKHNGASSALRQWACSKRSGLPRKVNNKNICTSSGNPIPINSNSVMEIDRSDLVRSSSMRSPILSSSRSSEDLISSPKTKTVACQPNAAQIVHNGKKVSLKRPCLDSSESSECPANGPMLKLSRSARSIIYSPRCSREDLNESTMPKPDKMPEIVERPPGSFQGLLKAKKSSKLKKNISSLRESNTFGVQKHGIAKNLHKHRSALGTGLHSDSSPDINGGLHGSTKDSMFGSMRSSRKMKIHVPKYSGCATISEPNEIQAQLKRPRTKNLELARGEEIDLVASRNDSTSSVDVIAEPSTKEVDTSSSGKTVTSEKLVLAPNAEGDNGLSEEEHEGSICQNGAQDEAGAERKFDGLEMESANVVDSEVVGKNIQMECDVETGGQEDSVRVQYTDCHAETASMQGSSACLTTHAEAGMEVPRENSSVTSIRIISNRHHGMVIERESSGSPVSTSSTISPRSPECSKLKDSDLERPPNPAAIQAKLTSYRLGFTNIPSVGGNEGTKAELRNREVQAMTMAKEPEFSDDQPCCCSKRENLSRDPRSARQSIMAGTTLLHNRKQVVSNLYIKPSIPSSFGPYSSPVLESPTGSISTMGTSDSAAKFSSSRDFGWPSLTQSTSKPILRLMGKNLMVSNPEESVQLPSPASDNPSTPRCLSPLGFPSPGNVSFQDGFAYHHFQQQQFPMASPVFGQHPYFGSYQMLAPSHINPMAGFAGSPLQTASTAMIDQQSPRKKSSKKPNSPSSGNLEKSVPSHQQGHNPVSTSHGLYIPREVIVIDDSSEYTEADLTCSLESPVGSSAPSFSGPTIIQQQQRPFSCLPPNAQYLSPEMLNGLNSSFPVSYSMNTNMVRQANSSHVSSPIPSSPFQFRSPSGGFLHPSLYYSETLR